MRDPGTIYTRKGTPLILVVTRLLFAAYFAFAVFMVETDLFHTSTQSHVWILYLLAIYYLMERTHVFFARKHIDLTYAFPLLFAMYVFNLVSIALDAQEHIPIINRAEHFISFIMIAFIVWTFFLEYLPQRVWRRHPYYTALIVFSVTSTLGVINEIAELVFDSLFKTRLIGSSFDTPLDLLMNSLGAGLFLSVRLILGTREDKSSTD